MQPADPQKRPPGQRNKKKKSSGKGRKPDGRAPFTNNRESGGGRDGNREGGRDGNREGGRDGNREGGRDGNRNSGSQQSQKRKETKPDRLEQPEFVYRPLAPLPKRTYKVVFYETVAAARADLENLKALKESCEQLNIVVRAEAEMDDPVLTPFGKVFAGVAWALIHDRRVADGWYNEKQ